MNGIATALNKELPGTLIKQHKMVEFSQYAVGGYDFPESFLNLLIPKATHFLCYEAVRSKALETL